MILVKDVMTKDPECVDPSDLVTKARSVMRKHNRRCFPVVEDGKLRGIVTRGDVMRVTSNKTNLLVEGIMTRNVITTTPGDDLFSCARKMIKAGIRQLPVAEEDTIVGIVSAYDILSAFVENDHKPVKKKISEIMTYEVVHCEPDDELSGIWNKMYASGFSGFPVLKKDRVIGMITRMDIIKEGSVRLSKESGKGRVVHVKKVMRTPAITIKPEAKTNEAAGIIMSEDIIRLPVTDEDGRMIGIVDIEDIIRAYIG
jgi:CBS domain-containing protein